MAAAPDLRTRNDIRVEFSVEDLRVFRGGKTNQPYAIVGHNPYSGLLTDAWVGGFDTEQEFRAVLEFIIEQFETGGYSYWLVDLRHLNTGFFHSDTWLAETAFPKAIEAGLVREAVVLPPYRGAPPDYDVFGSASAALRKITDGRVRGFTDIAEARKWLFGA
ncbi:MAG: STAS/SEC14 domain-containing protein [Alphaproteobacteria bacterium]